MEEMSSNNRDHTIDILKGVSIGAIMLLHYEQGIFPDWLNVMDWQFYALCLLLHLWMGPREKARAHISWSSSKTLEIQEISIKHSLCEESEPFGFSPPFMGVRYLLGNFDRMDFWDERIYAFPHSFF